MHKAFLFDCGNVLIDYSRDHHVDVFVQGSEEDKKLVYDAIFPDWYLQDAGLSSHDYCEMIKPRLPERLYPSACNIILHWPEAIWPIDGMAEIVAEIKKAGGKLILASNMPDVYPQLIDKVPVLGLFDDLVYSFPLKKIKPNKDFFEYILKKHDLKPEECLFVDDLSINIEAAKKLGIDSYLFDKKHPEDFVAYIHEKELRL